MKNKSSLIIFLSLFVLNGINGVHATNDEEVLVIKAGHILTINQGEILNGAIIIKKGKITEVGKDLILPKEARIIDASEYWVLPGLIEAHSTLGTRSRYEGSSSDETSDPNTAQMMIIDAVNPFNKSFIYAKNAGITSIMATPGRQNVIGGQSAVLKLRGKTVSQMTVLSPAGVKFSLGEGPKVFYGSKGRMPTTRMASAYIIRNSLLQAGEYARKWKEYKEKQKQKKEKDIPAPKRDLKLETLARVLSGELKVFIECYRVDDIMTALRLVDEFKLNAVLVGGSEGYKIPEEIAKRKIPVIVSPFGVGPRRMETRNLKAGNAAILSQAGVKIVIKSDDSFGMGNIRDLPLLAALAVKEGLEREIALQAITLNAAEVLGVSDRIGSIDVGKDADLVIMDGDPLYYRTRVVRVFIDGNTVYKQ